MILLSLGGWFEVCDLFFSGTISPGLNRSGLLTTTTVVAITLREAGTVGVFGLITTAMVIVIVAIAAFGPHVRGKPLDAL